MIMKERVLESLRMCGIMLLMALVFSVVFILLSFLIYGRVNLY